MTRPTNTSRMTNETRERLSECRQERTGRFERNVDALRQAGYNLKIGKAVVFVDGHAVHIGRFEELPTLRLQSLIAEKIGQPRREVDHV